MALRPEISETTKEYIKTPETPGFFFCVAVFKPPDQKHCANYDYKNLVIQYASLAIKLTSFCRLL
jgi:hypothetical protein